MMIPLKTRGISLMLKAVVVLAAAAGVYLSARAASAAFMGGGRVFMFFTIQSNILVALLSLAGAVFLLKRSPAGSVWPVIKFAGTVSITLTGAVFTFILAPTMGGTAWSTRNVLTHVVVPAAAIIDFFVTGIYCDIKKSSVFYAILPPAAYAAYAGIGYAAGWEFAAGVNYPYFFLDWGSPAGAFGFSGELPFMGCVWWILALLALLIIVGYVYLLMIDGIKKIIKKR